MQTLPRWFRLSVRSSVLLLSVFPASAAITITSTIPSYYSFGNQIQGIVLQATGAKTALVWSVSAGSLPPGLTLTSGGDFSGKPTQAGTYSFTLMAAAPQEPSNTPGTKQFTIGIPQITTASPLPAATVGVPYSIQFQSSDGPSTGAVWSVSLGGLPIGLTLDNKTGIYAGTPTRTGTFTLAVSVSFGVAVATKSISLTINAASPQTLIVTPGSLSFAVSAGNLNGSQTLAVSSSSGSAIPFAVQVDDGKGGPAPGWLNVTPVGGTTPALLRVRLVPQVLAAGPYTARIRVGQTATGVSLPPVDVLVTLTVSNPPPNLTVAPLFLRFQAQASSSSTQKLTFLLRNTGGGPAIPFTASVAGNSPWIMAIDSSSQAVLPDAPVEVSVTVNSQGFGAGTYRDAVRVTTSLGAPFDRFDVPVSLTIANQGSAMALNQTGLRFPTGQGNQGSSIQNIFVANVGSPGTTVSWKAQAVQGADLVTLVNPQGTSTPGNPTSFGIRLSNSAAASAGGKFALVQVSDPQSQNAPQYVVVLADIAATGSAPTPNADPGGLFFLATSNAVAPAAQTVTVNTTSASAVGFSIATSTDDGGKWLSATANTSTTSQNNPAQISVAVNPASLNPGVYRGTVNIAIGAAVQGVDITLLLAASQSAAAVGPVRPQATGCVPATVVLGSTGIFDNFSVPAGWPATLAAQAVDDCGNTLSNASVVASFSNGDAPVSLVATGRGGTYSATWQPGTAASQMTVTIDGFAPSLKSAEVQLAGSVGPNSRPAPSLAPGGLLNNLNPQVGAPLAPGTVTQVYGDNLADAPDQPSAVPLPVQFNGIRAIIGGLSAPVFYVSKSQLVVQIPSELPPQNTYPALVIAGDQITLPQNIDLAPYTPATVAFADGTLVAQRADGSLVSDDHPAKPGEALTIYLVGMGATTSAVPSGQAAPADPLPRLVNEVQLTVDGQQAPIFYAGLTPGGVGLYQINFTVPTGARPGKLDVVITQAGVSANATRLIVGQ